ncbi:MAG: recombinase family protein, partial [Hungatella sp.]|nr:recombinase family protein [Hungatella sp.]MCI9637877.1 recombinase family protein [Hungatella sp.]
MEKKKARFHLHNSKYDDKWNVGIYVRLSDEDRDKKKKTDLSQSIQNQTDYCRAFIEILNGQTEEEPELAEYKVYCDDDRTGMNFDRGGFQEMMRDIKENRIDCIVVKNLSRLGRYDTEMQKYLEKEFEQNGREVRLIAIGDNYDSLYKEPDIADRFRLLINREYSEQQHRNISIGMHSMQRKGLFVGAFAPYGYQKDPENKHHLIVDPTAALVVRRIYEEYLKGISPKEIAAGLTRDGIVNPAAYKRLHGSNFRCGKKISDEEVHWRGDGVKKILMDETYTGTLVQHKQVQKKLTDDKPTQVAKDQWIRCEGTHEAIISRERWKIAQSMMKTIKRDSTKEDEVTIFKGILKCGDCRHAMRKKWDSYTHLKTGETAKYLYYNCATFRDYSQHKKNLGENAPKCTSHYVSDKLLRKIVIDDLNKIIRQVE